MKICGILFAVASIWGMGVSAEAAFTFDDIEYWVGTGSNRAALVIDWNDGKNHQSLAWGYRWDGTAYGADMLMAIAGSGYIKDAYEDPTPNEYLSGDDSRLYACISDWHWGGITGYTVFGLGYDLDGDSGDFVSGYEDVDHETGYATDSDDHYKEGWYTGYWSYWLSNAADPWQAADWEYSGLGMGSRMLSDGDWDGWSFVQPACYGCGEPPSEPVPAVPEPVTMMLLVLGGIGLPLRERRVD